MINKIAIIVPVYNVEGKIKRCINSLINQTYKNIEIVVINDGSTDNTLQICKKFEKIDNRIKVYDKINGGVSSARNFGILKTDCQYITFVDSDDTVEPEFCEILIQNIENDNSDLSCCDYNVIINGKRNNKKDKIDKTNNTNKYIMLLNKYKGFLCNKLYKKEIIEKYNIRLKEDISMCEDLLFNFKYLEKCNKVSYSNEKKYNYFINNNGLSKGLNKNWFDILYVYNYIYNNIEKYDKIVQDNIMLQFMYAISETKMRTKVMNIEEKEIFEKYDINYYDIYMKYYKRLLFSKNIKIKEKVKLIIFYKFEWLPRYIKFRREK